MFRLVLVLLALSWSANSQWVSLGVSGGVPISPHSGPFYSGTIEVTPLNAASSAAIYAFPGNNDFYQKPYAVGPTVDFNLPWNVSLETGMLYERFHRDFISGLIVPKGGGPGFNWGYVANTAANAFAFPLLAKYTFGHHTLKPFVAAGATIRHLGSFNGSGIQLDFNLHPNPSAFQFDPDKAIDVAVTAGIGFRYRVAMLDVVPEIRFLHWTAAYEQPVQNQAMLILTFGFPARR
ncbi:MAG TPA: hypothetical protein VG273_28240 [Bryobacteraceae bacterium]|jgi:hypothetical protein|nr:hypothetical protein [Bryobacteraceae bacterium]